MTTTHQHLDAIDGDAIPTIPAVPVIVQTTLHFVGRDDSASETPMTPAKANDFITRLSSMWDETLQDAPSWDTIVGMTVTVR